VKTAFVLSGGGSLGAVQVGMLLALGEHGVTPDVLIGTSVGAVNAGWLAGGATLADIEALAEVWTAIRRQDVFPTAPVRGLLGFVGRRNHLVPVEPFRALLARNLKFTRIEDAPILLRVVTTDLLAGEEILLGDGNAIDAIPGVSPPVESRARRRRCVEQRADLARGRPRRRDGVRTPDWLRVRADGAAPRRARDCAAGHHVGVAAAPCHRCCPLHRFGGPSCRPALVPVDDLAARLHSHPLAHRSSPTLDSWLARAPGRRYIGPVTAPARMNVGGIGTRPLSVLLASPTMMVESRACAAVISLGRRR